MTVVAGSEADRDLVLRHHHHPIDREVVAVLGIFDDHVAGGDVLPAVPGIIRANRQLAEVDVGAFEDDFLTCAPGNTARRHRLAGAQHGFVENIFLRQAEGQRHPSIGREQLPHHRNFMALDVLKEQRRTVRPLVVNFANRAELVLRIDFDLDLLQLVLFFQDFEKFSQIHHAEIAPLASCPIKFAAHSCEGRSRANLDRPPALNPRVNSATRTLALPWPWQCCNRC